MLRPLTPEEIAPNLNFYAMDPLYKAGTPLGWATERIRETLDRGVVAMVARRRTGSSELAAARYRSTGRRLQRLSQDEGRRERLTPRPVSTTTDFVGAGGPQDPDRGWRVAAVVNGRERAAAAGDVWTGPPLAGYKAIKLRDDVRSVDRVGVGDLNADGAYDFVVKHPAGSVDPGRQVPSKETYKIDGYDGKTGAFLWRIDLGWNVNHGIWFSPMVVRDLDGDGKAEVCLRTAPYAATREQALDGGRGFVLQGPEYLSVYAGDTGREIAKVDWIERGQPEDWADHTGNRSSRHMLGVAYLDGKTPSVLVVRGTYGLMKVDAWTLRGGALQKIWRWTNERQPFKYQGQGQHSIKVGDIDGDGFDEILNGSIAIDNDGRTMWGTGMGHGDRFYLSDIDPDRPGLEVWYTIEDPHPQNGVSLWDAQERDAPVRHEGAESRQPDRRRPGGRHRSRRFQAWNCGATSSSSRRKARSFPARSRRRTSSSGGTLICCASSTAEVRSRNGRGQSWTGPRAPSIRWPTCSGTGGRRS